MSAHWSAFWQAANSLNSFSDSDMASGYLGLIATFWQQQFASLPAQARVLDIGTGNGAIAVMARQFATAQQFNWQILAADAAAIDVNRIKQKFPLLSDTLDKIGFFPNTYIEHLPFKSQSIDLITSQFAFEYAEHVQALNSCLHVLKPGGKLVAIIHHRQSPLLQQAATLLPLLVSFHSGSIAGEIDEFKHVLLQLGHTNSQQAYSAFLQSNGKLKMAIQQLLQDAEMQSCTNEIQPVVQQFAQYLTKLSVQTPQLIDLFLQELRFYGQRLQDQLNAAWSEQQCQLWLKQTPLMPCKKKCAPFFVENQLIGWHVQVEKL